MSPGTRTNGVPDYPSYFWKDGQVLKFVVATLRQAEYHKVIDCYCVDSSCVSREMRYGKWNYTGWVGLKLTEEFPAEFKTHLLLLGIT